MLSERQLTSSPQRRPCYLYRVDTAMADIKTYMLLVGQRARAAARAVARADTASKNAALLAMAALIDERSELLVAANQADLAAARGVGLDAAMLDRLT